MPVPFVRSLRSLQADDTRSVSRLVLAGAVLVLWAGWLLLARVTVWEASHQARLESVHQVHKVEAEVSGLVVASHLQVGKVVERGDVLVELDAAEHRLLLEEERAVLTSSVQQLEALRAQVEDLATSMETMRQAGRAAGLEADLLREAAEAVAGFAQTQSRRAEELRQTGSITDVEVERAVAEAQERLAGAEAAKQAADRESLERQSDLAERAAQLERLRREILGLSGEVSAAEVRLTRIREAMERRRIRAPVAGRLGTVVSLRPGAYVEGGEVLCAVVPPGPVQVVAAFAAEDALGRVAPGQDSRLRVDGFPWTQFGTIAARVEAVGTEAQDGMVRVELELVEAEDSAIPVQHGLTGRVEVAVERVSPAALVLRSAGIALGGPGPGG